MSSPKPILLGVNVDHVATIRQARGTDYPDPVAAAILAEKSGADGITMHLREDRRHVVESDIERMAQRTATKLNLEMAATAEMLKIAKHIRPADICLVPERRQELTTEGGLDVIRAGDGLRDYVGELHSVGIRVSLFIDPDRKQIDASLKSGAAVVELHTGKYANANDAERELEAIKTAAQYADQLGLVVNAGHGLHYENTQAVAAVAVINELNIGHAIVARAIAVGLPRAVSEMKDLMVAARGG